MGYLKMDVFLLLLLLLLHSSPISLLRPLFHHFFDFLLLPSSISFSSDIPHNKYCMQSLQLAYATQWKCFANSDYDTSSAWNNGKFFDHPVFAWIERDIRFKLLFTLDYSIKFQVKPNIFQGHTTSTKICLVVWIKCSVSLEISTAFVILSAQSTNKRLC